MWAIIKEVVNNIRKEIQEGDGFMAQLVAEEKGNTTLYEKFEKNSQFLTLL